MVTIYHIHNGYLGASREVADDAQIPAGWTRSAPPELGPGEAAVWTGGGWAITKRLPTPAAAGLPVMEAAAAIKAAARRRIEAIEGVGRYRVIRAEQRAALTGDLTERRAIYADIEAVRRRSDALEAAAAELDGAELAALLAAPGWPEPVAVVPTLTPLAFLRRFTAEERVAVRTAAAADPLLADFLDILAAADEVRLDDADLAAGVAYAETVGALAAGRAAAVLAPPETPRD